MPNLTLNDFLLLPNKSISKDVIEEGFDRLYMRKGFKYLSNYNDGYVYEGFCITVATVEVGLDKQRTGLFKNLIHKIRKNLPDTPIVVENVQTDYLIRHLHNNGWVDVFSGYPSRPPSFIDNIKLLEITDKVTDLDKIEIKSESHKAMIELCKSDMEELQEYYKKIGIKN